MIIKSEGIIFNLQKFSLHDGPGIRTVIFFKGCPLRCRWCSNPESLSKNIQISWDAGKCVLCGTCVKICPEKAITLYKEIISVDNEKCVLCMKCINNCPAGALKTEGEKKNVAEIIEYVMQDEPFYTESGGGVTLSGGEMSSQPEFALEILKELKARNIHTACETSGYCDQDIFALIMENIDLVLFDFKHYDRDKHFEGTGVYNDIIIKNLEMLLASEKDVIVRIPVIPGFNDSLHDASQFAEILVNLGVENINLLPFHQFGEKKYNLLGKDYFMKDIKPLHSEDLEDIKKIFEEKGLNCKIR